MTFTEIPNTDYIVPTRDNNFLPSALNEGTILLEKSIANLEDVINLSEKDTVIDAGALYGDTALIFAAGGATVYAFEPQADACIAAMWNTRNHSNIIVKNMALGNGEKVISNDNPINGNLGTRTLSVSESGFIAKKIDDMPWINPTFIKIDCEGFELSVISGAYKTILLCHPTFLIEIYPEMLAAQGSSKEKIYDYLLGFGYEIKTCIGEEDSVRWDIIAK